MNQVHIKVIIFIVTALICMGFTIPIVVSKSISTETSPRDNDESTEQPTAQPPTTIKPFEPTGDKLDRMRIYLQEASVNAFLIPANDAHQSEYVGESDRRVEYMTDFTGSNGYAIVSNDKAAIWVDGRYHIQVDNQVNPDNWTILKSGIAGVPSRS